MKENKSKVIITSIVTVFPMVIGFLLWNRLPEKIVIWIDGSRINILFII